MQLCYLSVWGLLTVANQSDVGIFRLVLKRRFKISDSILLNCSVNPKNTLNLECTCREQYRLLNYIDLKILLCFQRLRRSLPPSLLRRMSTSTWTTTTSATGMPTLELEPCRVRSSSFRHSRDTTPGSSPVGSRSNSPSPSSPTVVLTIPKSRSFSLAATQPSTSANSHLKRLTRKSVTPLSSTDSTATSNNKISPLVKGEVTETSDDRYRIAALNKEHLTSIRKNITSDYESCNESPSSSDHSDNIPTVDEFSASPPKKIVCGRVVDSSTQIGRVVSTLEQILSPWAVCLRQWIEVLNR